MKKLRINFFIPMTTIGGGIKIVYQLANGLKELGHDVVIYSPIITFSLGWGNLTPIVNRFYISLRNLFNPRVKWFDLKVPLIRDFFMRHKNVRSADFNIATSWPTAYFVDKIKNNSKKIYFIQGYETWGGVNKKIVDKSYKLSLEKITISKELLRKIKEISGNLEIFYLPLGIDYKEFFNIDKKFNEDKKILMIYSSNSVKGSKYGLETLRRIKAQNDKIKICLFGIKKPNYALFKYHFIHKPFSQNLRNLYCSADIFITPSIIEGFNLPPLEAMACKCAVVGTRTGVLSEVGVSGKNCLLSEPGDAESMGNNITTLLKDDKLLKKISLEGYRTSKQFDIKKTIRHFEYLLQNAD